MISEKLKAFYTNPDNIKRIRLGMALEFQRQKEILEEMYSLKNNEETEKT